MKKILYSEHVRFLFIIQYKIMVKEINHADFNEVTAKGIVVVDFFATRCGPCQMIAPYIDQMQEQLGESVTFVKVDVDANRTLSAEQDITAMPTLKIFNNGQVVETIVGADLQKLRQGIQNQLANSDLQQAA